MKKIFSFCMSLLLTGSTLFGQTTVFFEHFDGAWTLPPTLSPAWTGTTTPANNVWHRCNYITGWGSGSMGAYTPPGANSTPLSARFHTYGAYAASSGDLISPTINLSSYTGGVNNLDFYYRNNSGNDVLNVYLSTDNGATWSTSKLTLTTAAAWTKYTVTLGTTSATTKIKFTATSDYGDDDIGIDEVTVYNIIPPPSFTYTPLGNTASFTNRTLTTTISSVVGMPTSGIGLPSLYWKIGAGTWNSATGVFVSGSTYTFTFGAGVVVGDVVSYYIVAQDISVPTPLVSCSPSAGAAGLTSNPPAAGTPPTTPNTYTILVGTICGTKIIGQGGDYTTLTAAVTDLNNREMTCAVSFLFNASYSSASETFPIVINQNPGVSATNSLTIKPNTGVTATISGSLTSALIKVLNNYTTIDGSNTVGGTTRDLTITNTSANTPLVLVIGSTGTTPVTNCTLKNTIIINGANTSSALIVSDGASPETAPGYFNNITLQNNSVQKAYTGIYCWAATASGNGSGLLITGNALNTSGANSIRLVGICVQGVNGATVSNNNIGNITNALDASCIRGIWFATGTINSTISGNTITAMRQTSSSAPIGISITSSTAASNLTVTGNTITNLSTTSTGTSTGIDFYNTTSGITISNNMISNIKNSNTGGYGATGICLESTAGVSANCTVINNTIWDIAGYGSSGSVWNGMGMLIMCGSGYNIYFNTVYMNTEQTLTTGKPCALFIHNYVTTAGAIDLRDNIFSTIQTVGTNRYAIYSLAPNTVFSNIDYNDYYTTGPNLGYIGGINRATLADIQAGFGGNVNSLALSPNFVGTDLHPTNIALSHKGLYLPSVTTDITGAGRTDPPDMGAYQFSTNPVVTTIATTAITLTTATLNGTINANNATVTSGFEYGLTTTYGTAVAAMPASVTGSTVTTISAGLSGLVPCTLYYYRATGVSGGLTINGGDLTFTTSGATPTATSTAATAVTATTATLNGTVNANTLSTTVTFDYGLTVAYGTTVPGVPSPVTGSSVTAVSTAITGLLPGTTYHYRVNGANACETTNGTDLTFTTLALVPIVITTATTAITLTTATLNGTINANGASTAVTFDYGLTVAYGTTVPGIPSPVTGNTATSVSAALSGLVENTTYHYRVNGVNSIGTTNGNDMTFTTVCPVSGPAGPITGPTQVCQGGCGYGYSVTIPEATGYAWTLPVGGIITAGANTNTITVCYDVNSSPGSVFVYGTAACGDGASSQLAVAMNPPATPTLSGPASVCVNSTGNVYTTQTGMSNYVWTVSAGGTPTAGGTDTSSSITVTWTTTGAKTVSVNYNTAVGCPALTPTVYNVTVNALPVPTIAGPSPACSNFPGLVYTTQGDMTGYTWAISAGGTFSGQDTNAITVTWNVTGAQNVSVNYTNANGCTAVAAVVYPVTVNSGTAPTIAGTTSLCVNSGYYNYTTETSMTGYTWTISPGGTINYGAGTNVVTISWTASGAQWVRVNYTNSFACQVYNPTQLNITVNTLPGPAGTITGTATVCGGANGVAYSIDTVTGASTYVWTLPAGATIASGANTNSITVNFAANASSGNITVYANNLCGNGASSPPFAVTVTPLLEAAGNITGPASVCQGAAGVVYTVPAIAGASGYIWTVPAGVIIVSGANTNSITVDFSAVAVSGNITVFGTNSCGNGTVSPNFAVTVNAIPPTPVVTNTGYTAQSSAPAGNQWYYSVTQSGTGAPIAGATAQTYDATQTGSGYYWSIVTLNGCASDSSNHKLILMTGVDSHSSSAINVYPVPNDGRFNVSIATASNESFSISVYNSLGVKIYEETKVKVNGSLQKVIDLRPVPNGVYSVVVRNSLGQVVRKIIVNR